MSRNNFLAIPDQKDLFIPVRNEGSDEKQRDSPEDEDEENEDDIRLIPRSSPIPRKRGPSIADETAEYMRIRLALKRRVSFADATGGDLVDVREFTAFDSDDEDSARWEAEEARYRSAIREPTYRLSPDFQELSTDELMTAVRTGKVEVERLSYHPEEPLAFSGIIRVLNISFHKSVHVRSTMDGWGTYFDYPADYVEGSNDGDSDQFSFKLSFAPPYLFDGARIDFVVRYETSNGDFWANNSGKNYSVTLHVSYEDRSAHASGIDVQSLRSILKPPRPGMDYDYDSSQDYDEEGATRPETEAKEQPRPVQPVIVHPGMDIDVRCQEQESLSKFSTDLLQTTTTIAAAAATTEGTACFSTATELAPSPPATEMSPADQQNTTAQASTSLPLSEPKQQLGSEPNYASQQQQGHMPAAQKGVEEKEVTAIPACLGTVMALAPDVTTEDHSELMPSSAADDTDVALAETADIPYQLGLPELVPPPQSTDQEVNVSRKKDTEVTCAAELKGYNPTEEDVDVMEEGLDEMEEGLDVMEEGAEWMEEESDGIEEELDGIEETDTSEELEGSESHTLTALVSASSHIFEDCMRNERTEVGDIEAETTGREHADLKDVPQVGPWPLASMGDSLSEVVLPTHTSPTHSGPAGEDHTTHSPFNPPITVSDTDKSPAPLQTSKACLAPVSDASSASHKALTVTSHTGPVELRGFTEETVSLQYFTVTAPSTTYLVGPEEDMLDFSDSKEELVSSIKTSCPMLTSDVPEDAREHPGSSALAPSGSISIRRTLRPAMFGLSVVVSLLAALQEPSLFFILGLFLVLQCF